MAPITTPSPNPSNDVKREPIAKALIVTIVYKDQVYREWIEEDKRYSDADPWLMELGGDHETAQEMRDLLLQKYGYEDRNIVILREGSDIYRPPTKENIETEMRRLVADAVDGDRFAFFYSGHGDQKDAVEDTKESDGKDEYIIPWDHDNLNRIILDNDIRKMLVEPIKNKKVHFIGIFDCCHSGTIMDLEEYKYNEKDLPSFRLHEPSLPAPSATGLEAARGARNQRRKGAARHILMRPGSLKLGENYTVSEEKHSGGKATPQVIQYEDRFAPSCRPTAMHFTSPSNSLLMEKDKHAIAHDVLTARLLAHARGKADAVVTQIYPATQLSDSPEPSSPASPTKASFADAHVLANVTSWSACADEELNWENSRGEAMGKPMVEYLLDHNTPTYRELLLQLTEIMEQNFRERKAAYEQAGSTEVVIPQRPQLGSLRQLDLDTKMII